MEPGMEPGEICDENTDQTDSEAVCDAALKSPMKRTPNHHYSSRPARSSNYYDTDMRYHRINRKRDRHCRLSQSARGEQHQLYTKVLLNEIQNLFTSSSQNKLRRGHNTSIYWFHINSSNILKAINWFKKYHPVVYGYSCKTVRTFVLKLKVQMRKNSNVPFKLLDNTYN